MLHEIFIIGFSFSAGFLANAWLCSRERRRQQRHSNFVPLNRKSDKLWLVK